MKKSEKTAISALNQSHSKDQPLLGKTIVVTRARAQSEQMTDLIERLGGKVIHCPAIEIKQPDNWAALDSALERIDTYDWIIFTSANGSEYFFRRLAESGKQPLSSMEGLTVCAIGPATAKAIEQAGIRADVVAKDSKAEGALKAIIEHVGDEARIQGLRLLIPRARFAREVLPTELTRLGAHVDAVETYQTVKPDFDKESVIRLFSNAKVDAVAFTSSSTVSNFASLVEPAELSTLLRGVLVACIGPITTQTASAYNLKNIVQPESYNTAALVEAIAKAFESA